MHDKVQPEKLKILFYFQHVTGEIWLGNGSVTRLKLWVKFMIITITATERAGKEKATRVDPATTAPHIIPVVLLLNTHTLATPKSAVRCWGNAWLHASEKERRGELEPATLRARPHPRSAACCLKRDSVQSYYQYSFILLTDQIIMCNYAVPLSAAEVQSRFF